MVASVQLDVRGGRAWALDAHAMLLIHTPSDQLYHNKTKLTVDLSHVRSWDEHAADLLETKPTETLPLVRGDFKQAGIASSLAGMRDPQSPGCMGEIIKSLG